MILIRKPVVYNNILQCGLSVIVSAVLKQQCFIAAEIKGVVEGVDLNSFPLTQLTLCTVNQSFYMNKNIKTTVILFLMLLPQYHNTHTHDIVEEKSWNNKNFEKSD